MVIFGLPLFFCFIPTISGDYQEILELDLVTEEWRTVGNLYTGRANHAVSTITEDLWQYCA